MERIIRVGFVGPGNIVRRVMTDFHNAKGVELTAIASRSLERAQKAAQEYGARYAFGSYEEMAKCDEIDLVYIATPHTFHCEQSILMMEHGKHVLCEKPMALNEAETRKMAECARKNNVFLMEAMWTRFFPAMKDMVALINSGEIGEIRHIYSVFSYVASSGEEGRLFVRELAGGSLLDVGVYPLMVCMQLLGWSPEKVQSTSLISSSGIDVRTSVQMQYASGATAQIMSGIDVDAPSHLLIYGTKGWIMMDEYWRPTSFTVHYANGKKADYSYAPENEGHHYEFEEAARCIRAGITESPLMTLDESIAASRITEGIRREIGVLYPGEEA